MTIGAGRRWPQIKHAAAAVAGDLGVRALQRLPAERAHRLGLTLLRTGLVPVPPVAPSPRLRTRIGALDLAHPLGLAAGFDKDGEAIRGLFGLGFAFVEVGTVTPRPQPGNPKPRLFRLRSDRALINRMGFNNRGVEALAARLSGLRSTAGVLGINLGANRDSPDPVADYVSGLEAVASLADYVTINISSPNTPGLRDLQMADRLTGLLGALDTVRAHHPVPLFLKVAPDLDEDDARALVAVALDHDVDAFIVGNTTTSRPETLTSAHARENGGLSGPPLFERSTRTLTHIYRATGGRVPCIGVGGIGDGATAYAKVRAGAAALQLYTALAYAGPALVARTVADLDRHLARDGFTSLADAVGADVRKG